MPQYGEGGGPRPPYKESFLENIVGVSWQSSGGVFVSGDFCCYQRYARMERADSPQEWNGLGSLAFGSGGGTFASTYAKVDGVPTFLIGGHGAGGGGKGAVLMYSNDGLNWETVGDSRNMGTDIMGLVWDGDTVERNNDGQVTIFGQGLFYAHARDVVGSGDLRCFYSPDGKAWFYAYGTFASHCKLLPGVPDGIFGYDRRQDLLIFPGESSYPDIGDIFYKPNGLPYDEGVIYIITNATSKNAQVFPVTVQGTEHFASGSSVSESADTVNWYMNDHIAVAYVGGLWMVGGSVKFENVSYLYSCTACSVDSGNSWFLSTYGPIGKSQDWFIETLIAAPIRDFKNKPVPVLKDAS